MNAALHDMNAPNISASLNAAVSMPEMQRSFGLPLHFQQAAAPKELHVEASLQIDSKGKHHQSSDCTSWARKNHVSGIRKRSIRQRTAPLAFNANFALNELLSLLQVSGVQLNGDLQANGNALLDRQNNYVVDGTLNSRDLTVRSGTTKLGSLSLYSPFHADPFLVSLDGLKLNAFERGSLAAKVFIEKMEQLRRRGQSQELFYSRLGNCVHRQATWIRRNYRRFASGARRFEGKGNKGIYRRDTTWPFHLDTKAYH